MTRYGANFNLALSDLYLPEAGREAIEHRETTIGTQWIFALAQRAAVLLEFGPSGHSGCIGTDEVSSSNDWPQDTLLRLRSLALSNSFVRASRGLLSPGLCSVGAFFRRSTLLALCDDSATPGGLGLSSSSARRRGCRRIARLYQTPSRDSVRTIR
jgi:hypothetical protein